MIRDLIVIGSPTLVFLGTVLRMWDSMAEADSEGEFVPRNAKDELRRLFSFFTMLDRIDHAVPTDRYMYYLRTAQGWFSPPADSLCGRRPDRCRARPTMPLSASWPS